MYTTLHFPYRIEKEVGMALTDTGEPAEAFTEVKLQRCKNDITPEKYQSMHKSFVKDLAEQFGCDQKYITPISGLEYEAEVDIENADE